ncbi:MAG: signal recognition particle-docking protein FtsY [Chloroflexi bacterium]|nr:signal recognition particle-docking protein FtsY [Chloroflexota bacterium]
MKNFAAGLARTRQAVFGRIANLVGATEITADTWDELESTLIQADMGVVVSSQLVERLKNHVGETGVTRQHDLFAFLRGLRDRERRKPILAAADTFRAAAIGQLQEWGGRIGVDVIAGQPNGDPGAVVYDAIAAARSRGRDLVMVDTAGRLHTKFNLMEELKKVRGVAAKAVPGAPHSVLLVLDSTTGQNAIAQARAFKEAVGVTGVVLTKLDGSAKGGVAFAICRELALPIVYVGLGEKVEDLVAFDPEAFVDGLLSG